ncbi:hypothetical protein BJV82DRAFT_504306 [Fennellomyces sp. T-0311]|nr:hypothetical protein BJV82DRAFT_504306 [Fennellomyces sp. T-0311]
MPEAVASRCTMSIELLPEFGWSIDGKPVYGPGSVFQGYVYISPDQRIEADDIRLQFHAAETMYPIEISPGVLRAKKSQTLFAVQHILWKGQSLDPSMMTLPFTIQMPAVNYPPSVKNEYYQCKFKLTASITRSSQVLRSAEKHIAYRPFIETCSLKKPIQSPNGQLALHSLNYTPGDTIAATVSMGSSSGCDRRRQIVTAKLYQTIMLRAVDSAPKLTKIIATDRWEDDSNQDFLESDLKLDLLHIPIDTIPSFSYSSIITVSYQLKVAVKQKKLGGFWNVKQQEFDFPITIGTLGYGERAPTQLSIYSVLSVEEQGEMTPRFMRSIEYSDTLPLYDSTRLPTYENVIAI